MKKLTSAILTLLGYTEANASFLDAAAANDPTIADGSNAAHRRKPKSLALKSSLDDDDSPLPAPAVTDAMYYGLTGEVMREASDGREVHPAAAGIAFLCMAGVAFGRGRFVEIGNDIHHPRIFSVHVGRTSLGGKGMAMGLIKRIRKACEDGVDPRFPVCGQYHDGGLSTREGLAWAIRDASDELEKDGNATGGGVEDKRLFVHEDEFVNVLAQSKRDGNTLSAAIRTLWDGGDLAPLTKTNRTRATNPHVGIHACITPTELMKAIAANDLTNGFANRFLFVWGERRGIVAIPEPSASGIIDDFAKRLKEAIAFSKFGGVVEASREAREEFTLFYTQHRKGLGLPMQVRGLIQRHPPFAWRLALIFALLDCEHTITKAHMEAALAWLSFCTESVARIFSTMSQHADAAEAAHLVKRILRALHQAGGQLNRVALREAVGKPGNKLLNDALEQADMAGLVDSTSLSRKGGGRPTRIYTLKPGAAV